MSPFDQMGGEAKLRAIVDDFVDRCFDDAMIGFLFQRADRDRIKRFEYQHAAEHLGGPVRYGGRPLDEAHGPHRIFGGQFARRRQILIETLRDHDVEDATIDAWISHQDGLRDLITRDQGSDCGA
jgi:truncated hemoglobin YjbI